MWCYCSVNSDADTDAPVTWSHFCEGLRRGVEASSAGDPPIANFFSLLTWKFSWSWPESFLDPDLKVFKVGLCPKLQHGIWRRQQTDHSGNLGRRRWRKQATGLTKVTKATKVDQIFCIEWTSSFSHKSKVEHTRQQLLRQQELQRQQEIQIKQVARSSHYIYRIKSHIIE